MADPKPLLIVTGTKREAQAIAGPGVVVLCGGGSRERLVEGLERLVPECCGVLSFGMAGALSPDLKLGDWVVGTAVTGSWDGLCEPGFGKALSLRLQIGRRPPAQGPILGSDALIASSEDKAGLHEATGAIAADMESHIAGEVAARHGVRFAVLRCISDEAGADLPPAVAVAMKPGGGLAPGRIAWSLLRHPGQVPALLRTVRGFSRAFETLSAAGPRVLTGSGPARLERT